MGMVSLADSASPYVTVRPLQRPGHFLDAFGPVVSYSADILGVRAAQASFDGATSMVRRSFLSLVLAGIASKLLSAAEPIARNPRVLFIIDQHCERCEKELSRLRKPGGDFDAMRSLGWKIGDGPENHIQIVDREAIPEIDELMEIQEYPAVACIDHGEIVRSFKDGCTTPLDAWTFGFLLKGKNERPKESVPEAARVKTTGSYPLRGNHWSVDGDANPSADKVLQHLRGPYHGRQISPSYALESWSYEELRSLHDDLHEREIANGTAPAYATTQSRASDPFQFRGDTKATWGSARR